MTTGVPGPNAFSSHFPFLGEAAIQVDLRLELRQDKRARARAVPSMGLALGALRDHPLREIRGKLEARLHFCGESSLFNFPGQFKVPTSNRLRRQSSWKTSELSSA